MKRLLVLTSRFPYPLERGDKLRMYHQLRRLSAKWEVHLFAMSDQPVADADLDHLRSFCHEVHVFRLHRLGSVLAMLGGLPGRDPFQVRYFWRRWVLRQMREKVREIQPDLVYCQLLRMAPYARALPVPRVLDYMDCFSAGMARRIPLEPWWLRPLLAIEQRRLRRYEALITPAFQSRCIISTRDREELPLPATVLVDVIPNGVDASFFVPPAAPKPDVQLVFVGNMGYFPNVQAAQVLALDLLPRLAPGTRLLLAGARPAPEVQRLASLPGVELTGWLDDIRQAYARGQVFVAPLFSGSGQQNKILEAMSMGMPCITTSLVNEGIGATPGTEIVVADSQEEWEAAIRWLLKDEEARKKIGAAARAFVLARYDWDQVAEQVHRWLLGE